MKIYEPARPQIDMVYGTRPQVLAGGTRMVELCPEGYVAAAERRMFHKVDQVKQMFLMDREAGESIQRTFKEKGHRFPIFVPQDAPLKEPSPAGWITDLSYEREVGLIAHVELNEYAAGWDGRYVANLNLVPVFQIQNGRAVALESVELSTAYPWSEVHDRHNPPPWATGVVANSLNTFTGDVNAMEDRLTVIENAGAEWDAHRSLQVLTDRVAFCKDALRQKGLAMPDEAELLVCASPGGGSARTTVLHGARREWHAATPEAQRHFSLQDYVNGTLIANRMPGLTDSERNNLR